MKFHSLRAKLIGIYMIVFMLFVGVVGVTLTVSYKHNLTKMREDAVVECAKEIARMYSVGELQSVDIESGNTVPVLNTTAKDFDAVIQVANTETRYINYELNRSGKVSSGRFIPTEMRDAVRNDNIYIKSNYFNEEIGETVSTIAYPIRRVNESQSADPWAIIVVHSSLTSVNKTFEKILSSLWIPAVAVTVTGCLVFLTLTRGITARIDAINSATKEIAKGKFDTRLNFSSRDEITELAQGFNKMAESLKISDASKRDFVSNAAHELRSPMTSINGFVEGMLDGTIPKEKYTEYLTIVSSEVKRLTKLVNNMLDLSRIESGRETLTFTEFDITELIRRVIIRFGQKIDSKGIVPEINMPETKVRVIADPDKIERILQNLIDNAIKFTPAGKRLIISCTPKDKKVYVSVKDEGAGISKEDLKFIWDRFYTVDKAHTGHKSGTGLGLAIVKSIIEQHGQEISVSSEQGAGTEFVFTLEYAGE